MKLLLMRETGEIVKIVSKEMLEICGIKEENIC